MASLSTQEVINIPLAEVQPDPTQPRAYFDNESLGTLAKNIAEHGVLEPILVRSNGKEGFIIVAGERRWRASMIAELETIPAIVRDDLGEVHRQEVQVSENVARQDFNPMEEARVFKKFRDRGLTVEEIAVKAGALPKYIEQRLSFLKLEPSIQRLLEHKQLYVTVASELAKLDDFEHQHLALRAFTAQGLSLPALQVYVNTLVERLGNTKLFTPEQVKERSAKARTVRENFNRMFQLAVDAVNILLDPKQLTLLPEALDNDMDLTIKRLRTLEYEVKRVRSVVEAAAAQKKVDAGGGKKK